jgi:hypothetical protein
LAKIFGSLQRHLFGLSRPSIKDAWEHEPIEKMLSCPLEQIQRYEDDDANRNIGHSQPYPSSSLFKLGVGATRGF